MALCCIKTPPLKITPRIKAAAEALVKEDGWSPEWTSTPFAPGYYRRAAAVVAALEDGEAALRARSAGN